MKEKMLKDLKEFRKAMEQYENENNLLRANELEELLHMIDYYTSELEVKKMKEKQTKRTEFTKEEKDFLQWKINGLENNGLIVKSFVISGDMVSFETVSKYDDMLYSEESYIFKGSCDERQNHDNFFKDLDKDRKYFIEDVNKPEGVGFDLVEDLTKLNRADIPELYDYIANNYYLLSKEELKELILNLTYNIIEHRNINKHDAGDIIGKALRDTIERLEA